MVFFPEPLRPSEGRKEDHIIVDPIEADKKTKREGRRPQPPEEKKQSAIYGALLIFFNRLTTLFLRSEGESEESLSQDDLLTSVQTLKQLIQSLKEVDQSGSVRFCQQLSDLWHALYQELQSISHSRRRSYVNIEKLIALLTDMEHFPPNEDHKLGFYLENYAGEKWLPFPFREILKALHSDHRVNQEYSTLNSWSELITEILQG
ncbi:MAG: hypothetical protein K1060chlam2_00725 [Chlamydiae bacterium]|nr:hypothetical protein [Chlamydiota bacterium]